MNYKAAYLKAKELIELIYHEPEKDDELRLHQLFKTEMERLESEIKQIEEAIEKEDNDNYIANDARMDN